MRTALVTGASGFVGAHLVEALARDGWRVRRVVRPGSRPPDAPPNAPAGVTTHVVRTADADAWHAAGVLADVDVAFHVAGVTRARDRAAFDAGNVAPTAALLAALQALGTARAPARLVLVSSQAAAGPAAGPDAPRTEDDPPAPVGAYGASKRAAERLVEAQGAVPWTIVRPSAVYGPRDRDFLALFRLAARGVALHAGTRDAWLSLVHVHDLGRALVAAGASSAAVGRTYFVAGDEALPWTAVWEAAAHAAGTRLRRTLDVPRWALALGAAAGDAWMGVTGRPSLLGREKLALAAPRWWLCSAARARRELAWAPTVPLARGAAETLSWYREAGWL